MRRPPLARNRDRDNRSGDGEPDRQIVVTIRRRPRRPDWSVPRSLAWAGVALAGDPLLLLAPVALVVVWVLGAFTIGVPSHAEVIVPIVTPPPADSYQDIGIVGLSSLSGAAVWVARGVLAAARALSFAGLAALALARAGGRPVTLAAARGAIRRRSATIGALGALSFGYALLVSQQSSLDPAREATVAATALAVGMLVWPAAFVGAAAGRRLPGAVARGLAPRRPLGHVVLVAGYGAALNGLYRLASFGEPGRPRALSLALYAVVAAWLAMLFTLTLARRAVLLDGDAGAAPRAETPEIRT